MLRLLELRRLQAEVADRGESARREAARAARRWLYDPVGWSREVIDWSAGGHLTGYQDEILAALARERKAAVRGPHGLGKTTLVSITLLWFASTRDAAGYDWKVITTASAWRQLSVYLWPEIHKWARRIRWDVLGRTPWDEKRELLDLHLKLSVGAASAVASNDPAKIEGAHADSLLYVFDESKAIPAETWDAAEGAFSGGQLSGLPEAFALAVSTPGPPSGRFYEIHKRAPGLEDWWTRHVTVDEAVAAGRISRPWVDQRRRQWGETSSLYANRVLGEFHADDEDAVIPLAWLEAAVERWHAWDDAGRPPVDGKRVLGVDVARGGADSTVLAHRVGVCVERLESHVREDTMRTTARVIPELSDGAAAVVDSIGVGGGVVDRLRELRLPVLAFTGSAKTNARDRTGEFGFSATRSAAWWRVRELLDPAFSPEVMLPPDDELLADLTAPTWTTTTGVPPKIQIEKKEDLVARLGRSPDRGDAVAMSFWADALRHESTVSSPRGHLPVTGLSPLAGQFGQSPLGPLG